MTVNEQMETICVVRSQVEQGGSAPEKVAQQIFALQVTGFLNDVTSKWVAFNERAHRGMTVSVVFFHRANGNVRIRFVQRD